MKNLKKPGSIECENNQPNQIIFENDSQAFGNHSANSDSNQHKALNFLALLTDFEKHQLLVEWNPTIVNENFKSIIELFKNQVKKTPYSNAVIFENSHLTYEELDQKSDRFADYFKRSGVEPETTVGLCLLNNLHLIVAILGILKAGGVYVPLDPSYPTERLQFMLEDAKPSIIVTQSDLIHLFTCYQKENRYTG